MEPPGWGKHARKFYLWGVCGSGKLTERLAELTSSFTIETCAYAVLSNHYHLVVYVDQARSIKLSQADVVERWIRLCRAPPLIERWRNGSASESERSAAEAIIEKWRKRLCDLSWFMKLLNEHLARRANAEDHCSGRFWEGRFRSQALLFGIEIEGCARCGGKLKIIASIEEPEVIARILSHLEKTAPEHYQAELPLGARAPPGQASLL